MKLIPCSLNLLLLRASFHFVFIDLVLILSEPVQTNCVLSKLLFKPAILENFASSSRV